MKTERVVLAVIAIIVGLAVAGIAFFIYQSTKTIPSDKTQTIKIVTPTPTPAPSSLLSVDSPADESVVPTRSITISGKTTADATIIVNTSTDDQVVAPAANGNYSLTTTLADGENLITITAIGANGDEVTKTITVTSSLEQF